MRLFLWCVLLKRESEKGGKTKKRTTLFLCTPVQTYKLLNKLLAIGYYQITGSALFFVVELSIIIKNKTLVPPAGTILYSPSDRERERYTRQFRTRSARAKTVLQLAKRSNHLTERGKKRERKKI